MAASSLQAGKGSARTARAIFKSHKQRKPRSLLSLQRKQGKEQKKKKKAANVKPAASKPNLGSIGSLQSKDIATQIADPLGGSIVHSLQGQVCLRRNPLSYLCMAGLPEV